MLAEELRKLASNFSGTPREFTGPSDSFISFIKERATRLAINGHMGMAFRLPTEWSLEEISSSLPTLRQYGFDANIVPEDDGEFVGFIVTIEWK